MLRKRGNRDSFSRSASDQEGNHVPSNDANWPGRFLSGIDQWCRKLVRLRQHEPGPSRNQTRNNDAAVLEFHRMALEQICFCLRHALNRATGWLDSKDLQGIVLLVHEYGSIIRDIESREPTGERDQRPGRAAPVALDCDNAMQVSGRGVGKNGMSPVCRYGPKRSIHAKVRINLAHLLGCEIDDVHVGLRIETAWTHCPAEEHSLFPIGKRTNGNERI